MKRWEVKRIRVGVPILPGVTDEIALEQAREEGWEPFAATSDHPGWTYHLRRDLGDREAEQWERDQQVGAYQRALAVLVASHPELREMLSNEF
jgi:hypothetical protein